MLLFVALKLRWEIQRPIHLSRRVFSATNRADSVQELCVAVLESSGGLDELESNLNKWTEYLTSSLVTRVIDSCKNEASSRRLLRFFLWSSENLQCNLEDKDYNHAVRALAGKKDKTAMEILIRNFRKEGRAMESQTFSAMAEILVNLGREDEALGLFKNLNAFQCPQDKFTVTAIITALCAKGHAKKAEGVVHHHKDKISEVKGCVYRSLLHGWSVKKNVKEVRRIIKEMKSDSIIPDLFCYNTLLRCLCEQNVTKNPSGLVPEALNVMMEMRSYKISPTPVSYNILLCCLCRVRRVKESCNILEMMKKTGCSPDSVSYYLVARVLYLTGRFGKGNDIIDEMIGAGLNPDRKFYRDLIGVLCGLKRENYALELLERMKRSGIGGCGPVYDILIPKLCKRGDFEKGRELWEEAISMGVSLSCSSDVLDPSITEVFEPTGKKKTEKIELTELAMADNEKRVTEKMRKTEKKKKKKNQKQVAEQLRKTQMRRSKK